jgi:hypothetical protein
MRRRAGGAASVIGRHELSFTTGADSLTVRIDVEISVGLGPIRLFHYTHQATEQWQGGRVMAIDARTSDDGTDFTMSGHRSGDSLIIEGTKAPRYTAPPHALPGTHWNKAMLDGPIINTQDGRLMTPTVTLIGSRLVPAGSGPRMAHEYQLRGDLRLDTWYDPTPEWVGLRFTAHDGSVVVYELT